MVGIGYTITKKVAWSLQIWKEIELSGSVFYGMGKYNNKLIHAFDLALMLMEKKLHLFKGLVSHTFRIQQYKDTANCLTSKRKFNAIKVAFDFR